MQFSQDINAIGIHSNHRDMARFATEDDSRFVSVVSELLRRAKEIKFPSYEAGITGAREVLDIKGGINSAVSNRSLGGSAIWGDVVNSNVVNGSQNISYGLKFNS
jgi:hypothetical protein